MKSSQYEQTMRAGAAATGRSRCSSRNSSIAAATVVQGQGQGSLAGSVRLSARLQYCSHQSQRCLCNSFSHALAELKNEAFQLCSGACATPGSQNEKSCKGECFMRTVSDSIIRVSQIKGTHRYVLSKQTKGRKGPLKKPGPTANLNNATKSPGCQTGSPPAIASELLLNQHQESKNQRPNPKSLNLSPKALQYQSPNKKHIHDGVSLCSDAGPGTPGSS